MAQKKSGDSSKKQQKSNSAKKKSSWFRKLILLTAAAGLIGAGLLYAARGFEPFDPVVRYLNGLTEVLKEYRDASLSETWDAVLLFGDEESDYLLHEYRKITSARTPGKIIEALMRELLKGPLRKGIRTVPEETLLRSVVISTDRVARVDFSKELVELHPGGSSSELMTVYSIVNTILVNVEEASRVKLLVEGRTIDTIAGHINCSESFVMKKELLK